MPHQWQQTTRWGRAIGSGTRWACKPGAGSRICSGHKGGRWQRSSEKGGQGGRRYRAQLPRPEQRPMQKHTECMQQDSTPSSQHSARHTTSSWKAIVRAHLMPPYPTSPHPRCWNAAAQEAPPGGSASSTSATAAGFGCSGVRPGAGAPHPLPTGRRQPAPLGRGGGVRLGAVNRAPCGSAAGRHATSEARAPRPLAAWHAWLFALCLCGSDAGAVAQRNRVHSCPPRRQHSRMVHAPAPHLTLKLRGGLRVWLVPPLLFCSSRGPAVVCSRSHTPRACVPRGLPRPSCLPAAGPNQPSCCGPAVRREGKEGQVESGHLECCLQAQQCAISDTSSGRAPLVAVHA